MHQTGTSRGRVFLSSGMAVWLALGRESGSPLNLRARVVLQEVVDLVCPEACEVASHLKRAALCGPRA